MKYIISLTLIATLFSCNNSYKDCKILDLNNKITICNWGIRKIKNTKIKLFVYDKYFIKKLDSNPVNKVLVFDKKSLSDYKKMIIYFNTNLTSTNNYRLIIEDTLKYDISNIKIYTKTVMIGMREKRECFVKTLKINNFTIKPPEGGSEISMSKNN